MSGHFSDSFGVTKAVRPNLSEVVAQQLLDLLEARQVIEVEVARLAGQRRTDAEIGVLEAILRAHESATAKAQSPATEGMRFHLAVGYAAHNEVLAAVMRTLCKPMFERGPSLYEDLEGFSDWELRQHTGIYLAIRDQNANLAARRMAAHVAAMAGHYRRAGEA